MVAVVAVALALSAGASGPGLAGYGAPTRCGPGGPRAPTPRFEAAAHRPASVSPEGARVFPQSRPLGVSVSPSGRAWSPAGGQRPEPDAWLAEDKLKHMLLSFAATLFAGAGARTIGLGHKGAVVAGAGCGVAAGIWKELHDRATGGDVSARDLTADAVGVAGATIVAAQMR